MISILIAAYKEPHLIGRAIEAFLSQLDNLDNLDVLDEEITSFSSSVWEFKGQVNKRDFTKGRISLDYMLYH